MRRVATPHGHGSGKHDQLVGHLVADEWFGQIEEVGHEQFRGRRAADGTARLVDGLHVVEIVGQVHGVPGATWEGVRSFGHTVEVVDVDGPHRLDLRAHLGQERLAAGNDLSRGDGEATGSRLSREECERRGVARQRLRLERVQPLHDLRDRQRRGDPRVDSRGNTRKAIQVMCAPRGANRLAHGGAAGTALSQRAI